MTDSDVQQSQRAGGHGEEKPMFTCPMASMCKGMAEKPPSLVLTLLPGIIMILIGILIILEPKILAWLVALMSILIGIMMIMVASFIRRFTGRFQI